MRTALIWLLAAVHPAMATAQPVYPAPGVGVPGVVAALAVPATVSVLPANTEIALRVNNDLTTKSPTSGKGATFSMSVVRDVRLGAYIIIPKGARAIGEVIWRTGKGAFGKSGKIEVALRYVEVGGQRIPIEGKFRQEGAGNTVATIGGIWMVGIFAGFITGESATIEHGRELIGRTISDIPIILPIPPIAPIIPIATDPLPN